MSTVTIRNYDDFTDVIAIIEAKEATCNEIEEAVYKAKEIAKQKHGSGWTTDDVLANIKIDGEWKIIEPYFGEKNVYI